MKPVPVILGALCLLPVAYLVYSWGICSDCTRDADTWLYSLVALLALPFLLAAYALVSAFSGARTMRDHLAEGRPAAAAASGGLVWLTVIVAVPMLFASYQLYGLFFPDLEEGRDRLGRICEEEGSRTVCRPDPGQAKDGSGALADLNRANRERRGF